MARKSTFVKASGDIQKLPSFRKWIKKLGKKSFVVNCVGGGSQINNAFKKKGRKKKPHGPLGRELKTWKDRQLARDILENNRIRLEDNLAKEGIMANVMIPVFDLGSVLCHANADLVLMLAYNGFDTLFAVTTKSRLEKKKKLFAPYPKIKVIAF